MFLSITAVCIQICVHVYICTCNTLQKVNKKNMHSDKLYMMRSIKASFIKRRNLCRGSMK